MPVGTNPANRFVIPRSARPLILAALAIVLIVAAWLLYRWYTEAPTFADALKPGSVVSISATELTRAYDQDPISAHTRYDGRTLRVTGTLKRLSPGIGNPVLILGGPDPLVAVTAALDTADADRLSTLPTGQPITVTCRGLAFLVDAPALNECVLQ